MHLMLYWSGMIPSFLKAELVTTIFPASPPVGGGVNGSVVVTGIGDKVGIDVVGLLVVEDVAVGNTVVDLPQAASTAVAPQAASRARNLRRVNPASSAFTHSPLARCQFGMLFVTILYFYLPLNGLVSYFK
jgi:hypothetical protein